MTFASSAAELFSDAFLWPAGAPWLIVVVVVALVLVWSGRRRASTLRRVVGPRIDVLASDFDVRRRRFRDVVFVAALGLSIVALLQPSWGEGGRRLERRGIDIVLCLDVSRSMLARDMTPNRLDAARSAVKEWTTQTRGDRVGLVTFAGDATPISPLTEDVASLVELMNQTGPLTVTQGGTSVGAALEAAIQTLDGGVSNIASGTHEVVVLLSDGEDLDETGRAAAEACRERGIVVHTVGFGSPDGAKIPVPSRDGKTEYFVRDADGQDVVTTQDSAVLHRIATITDGIYIDAASSPNPMITLHERSLSPMTKKSFDEEHRAARANRYQWALAPAVILWILGLALTDRRRRS